MKRKMVVALTLSYLFWTLLHSNIPIVFASTIEENESVTGEEFESIKTIGQEDLGNLEDKEDSTISEKDFTHLNEKESIDMNAINETDEDFTVKKENQSDESFVNTRVLDLGIFEDSEFEVKLKDRKLILTYIGKGLTLRLSDLYFTFFLPDDIDIEAFEITDISAKHNNSVVEEIEINNVSNSVQLRVPIDLLDVIGGLLGGLLGFESVLEVEMRLDKPVLTTSEELIFGGVSESNALIDIDLLSSQNYHTSTITRPKSPELSQIYSNTVLLRGVLPTDFQSSSIVKVLLPDGTSHQATISGDNFNLRIDEPLAKGAEVKAIVITEDGLTSMPYSKTVQAALPPLIVPKSLNFGAVTIGSDVIYKFLEKPLEITVQDTRGSNEQWQLQAHIDEPLTTESGHTLPNALGFYENNEFKPFTTNETGTKGEAIAIATRTTQDDKPVPLKWDPSEEKGPAIKIDHSTVYAEPYSTDITWTLVNSVQ